MTTFNLIIGVLAYTPGAKFMRTTRQTRYPSARAGKLAGSSFSGDKFIFFSITTTLGVVVQIWILFLTLTYWDQPRDIGVLLGDGGLFFFSTPLILCSLLTLLFSPREAPDVPPNAVDYVFTALAMVGGLITGVTTYVGILTKHLKEPSPFHGHVPEQVSCALLALAYALFVAKRTGQFRNAVLDQPAPRLR